MRVGADLKRQHANRSGISLAGRTRLSVAELVAEQASRTFAGRKRELACMLETLRDSGPSVMYLHGIAGIGKSRLISAFAERAGDQGAVVAVLDCRSVEPTPEGFLRALGSRFGRNFASPDGAVKVLGGLRSWVVLALDHYEVLRLLDTWLRQDFVPRMPGTVRLVLADREPPAPSWTVAPGWHGIVRTLELNALPAEDALTLLDRLRIPGPVALRINRIAQGHPLAVTLAASSLASREDPGLEDLAIHSVINELTRLYVAEISDPITRKALHAGCVLRRITVSLLSAMLPGIPVQEAFTRLQALPFVNFGLDGLHIHDSVKQVLATALRAGNPAEYCEYRRAAWAQLRAELANAPTGDLWRYTADMLFLLENSVIREAFFPSGGAVYSVEPAMQADGEDLLSICSQHESPGSLQALKDWWNAAPESFSVVRDRLGKIVGFYCLSTATDITESVQRADAVARSWLAHLSEHPLPRNEIALFLRRWMSADEGEGPSAVQAACWLDIKRTYVALRPRLRRVYLALENFTPYAPVAQTLGFVPLPEHNVSVDGKTFFTAMLDFGPYSVDGWLTRLVAAELGVDAPDVLDVDARELVIDNCRIRLTRLEFQVFRYLREREGKAVPREDLIRDVWGHKFDVGSNVVDAVIKGLRKKLGKMSESIETVAGFGYRLRVRS